jgi:CBS domain-containing protein
LKVSDIMTRQVETVRPDDTLHEAAAAMDWLNVGFLPVHDGSRVVGIVTDRDIAVHASEHLTADLLRRISEPSKPDRS